MKNKIEVEKTIIVTKDNFQSSLKEFKEIINSKLFDYIILNNDISTSNPKIQDKEGEIVFSEFTLCKKVNYQGKDISYTFTTFLVPSLKFHRYAVDEIASFSSIFLKFLTNERSVYDFNLINATNSLSYDNIHKREEFEKSLNLILKDGKPFKKENKTSYYYYPKAFELPSKKYQKQFEEYLKYFLSQNFDENAKKIENEDKTTFLYESDKYASDFKFLNNFLDFKWGQIFEKMDSDMYKIFVDEFKIIFTSEVKFGPTFLKFVEKLKNYFENEKSIDTFELELGQEDENEINDEFFKNWKKYIMAEESVAEFSYEFTDNNKINFSIKADKSKEKNKFQNLMKFLSFILSVPSEISNKKEFQIKQIYFRRINMRNLFPEKDRNNIEFYYHLISKVDKEKLKPEKTKEYYLAKISYKKIFVHNKNEEEILFGYKLEPPLKSLFESKDLDKAEEDLNKTKIKTISLELGKDLDILLEDETIKQILKEYYSKFKLLKLKENDQNKFRTIEYVMTKIPNYKDKMYQKDLQTILNKAKEIKKKLLLDEEIGMTYFYDAIFKKEGINIYGTNLKNKIYFPIRKLLLEPNKNSENEIQKIIEKVNIYDMSYICKKENKDFFQYYLKLKKEEKTKERTVTQRLGYVIEEIEILNNREKLDGYKNKFYIDEKDKILQKNYICIDKNKFYGNAENIVKIFKDKTDFTINKNANDNNLLEFNIIDPNKRNEIEGLEKAVVSF